MTATGAVRMRSKAQARLLAGFFLFGLASAARGFDLWQSIEKKIEDIKRTPTTADKPHSEPAREIARALSGFSLKEEISIGRKAAGSLLGVAPMVKNPRLQAYVNQVGRWVANQSTRPGLDWHFGVIESNDLNAFAAPGGYVLVTRGLYGLLRSESELAGVLAHEIAHVDRKHHLKLIEQRQLLDRGRKLISEHAGDDQYIRRLIGSGAEIFSRALDKKVEYEADRLAMILAARAGYDPFGLPVVLQELALAAKDYSRVKLLFKTHPHPDERLAQLDAIGARLEKIHGKTNVARFIRIAR